MEPCDKIAVFPLSAHARRAFALCLVAASCLLSAAALPLAAIARNAIPSGAARPPRQYESFVSFDAAFAADGASRACWDIPLRHDLSRIAAIRLRLRCRNASVTSQLTLHIFTGNGWYSATVTPRTDGLWEELVIPKSAFQPEESAGRSWSRCTRLRLNAWRGAAGDFQWQLAHLEFLAGTASLAMLRGGLAATPSRPALQYAKLLGDGLAAGGVYPAVIDEPDATIATLRNYPCILVPAPEACTPQTISQLTAYLQGGGRLMLFHALPPLLAQAMRLPSGKFRRAAELPRPLAAIRTPFGTTFRQNSSGFMAVQATESESLRIRARWLDTTGAATAWPAILQSPGGLWMTHVYLNQDPAHAIPLLLALLESYAPGLRRAAAAELLATSRFALANAGADATHPKARKALQTAEARAAAQDYPALFQAVRAFQSALADEVLTSPVAPAGLAFPPRELRGAWMRAATGLPGHTWGQTMRLFAGAHFNALFPHVLSPHAVAWATDLRGVGRFTPASTDPVAECLAAAANHGVQVHAWCHVLSLADAPEAIRRDAAANGLLQRRMNGTAVPWLCPSRRENRDRLRAIVTEMLQRYRFHGIHFDMLRFEGSGTCYCDYCRNTFAKTLDHPLRDWPECTLDASRDKAAWLAFRKNQIRRLLEELAATARSIRPGIRVSAAVYPELANARDAVGQEWTAWLQRNAIDFVCPMDYRPAVALFQGDLARQKTLLGPRANRLFPGIGATTSALDAAELRRQIQAVRNAGLDGFLIFEYTPAVATDLLPAL